MTTFSFTTDKTKPAKIVKKPTLKEQFRDRVKELVEKHGMARKAAEEKAIQELQAWVAKQCRSETK